MLQGDILYSESETLLNQRGDFFLTLEKGEHVSRMCFTVNSPQSSPIELILSSPVKQTEERGRDKDMKGGPNQRGDS